MKYGLIGYPLEHSISPMIHSLLGDYPYELHPLPEEEFDAFMKARDFAAVNVTIPYKQRVISYCDLLTDKAKAAGSVNLLYKMTDGALLGDNTDYDGLMALLSDPELEIKGNDVVILGSGGTSHTAQAVAKALGAADVAVVSRSGALNYENFPEEYGDREFFLINTTPVGMYPHGEDQPVDLYDYPDCLGAADVIYNPLKSKLCDTADQLGLPWAGGLRMLVVQAAAAASYFGARERDEDEIDEIYETALHRMQNIVLVGMPGCGKSTVGALLAKKTGRDFYDSDELFREESGTTPAECIRRFGENGFRRKEHEILLSLAQKTGCIIATGGGAVLDPDNMDALRQNGVIFWLRREVSQLDPADRPLSADLPALYEQREPFYEMESDFSVENNRTPEAAADALWEVFNG